MWAFWGRFREVWVTCLQTGFQSSIDLDIHLNSRKEDLNFKFRKIIALPCTCTEAEKSIVKKEGFSSALAGGTAEEFQPHPCKIRYLFWINPTKCFPPSQHSYLLVWQQQSRHCAAGWQAASRQLRGLCRDWQGRLLSKASGLLQGKDSDSSQLPHLWGYKGHQSLCYQGNSKFRDVPCYILPISCSHPCKMCTHIRKEGKRASWLASWTREALRDPPFFCLKMSK